MTSDPVRLSERGQARRAEILGVLVGAQRKRRARRIVGRAAAGLAVMTAGVAVWAAMRPTPAPGRPAAPLAGPISPVVAPVTPLVETVRNDPSVVARYTARGDATVVVIDDEALEGLLRRAGRPPGHIRTPDRFILASDIAPPAGPSPGSG